MIFIREKTPKEWFGKFAAMGIACVVMSISAAFFYIATLPPSFAGVDTVGVFMRGIELTFSISYGTATLIVNGSLLLLSLIFMRKNIYFATIMQIIALGTLVDLFISPLLSLSSGMPDEVRGILFTVLGVVGYGIGIGMYLPLNWGTSPMDGFILIVYTYTPMSYSIAFAACCTTVALIGFALGGEIGYATVLSSLLTGFIVDFSMKIFRKVYLRLRVITPEDLPITQS